MDLKKMKALLTKKHGSEWMLEVSLPGFEKVLPCGLSILTWLGQVKLDRWVISAPGKLTDVCCASGITPRVAFR